MLLQKPQYLMLQQSFFFKQKMCFNSYFIKEKLKCHDESTSPVFFFFFSKYKSFILTRHHPCFVLVKKTFSFSFKQKMCFNSYFIKEKLKCHDESTSPVFFFFFSKYKSFILTRHHPCFVLVKKTFSFYKKIVI
jgi:hypothetical protein